MKQTAAVDRACTFPFSLSCERQVLAAAVQQVARGAATSDTTPILQQVLLEADHGTLRLAAMDREISLTSAVPAPGAHSGRITAPARVLYDILDALSATTVSLASDMHHGLTVTAGRARYTLRGLPAATFPAMPPVTPQTRITLHAPALRGLLRKTLFAVATEGAPVLTGALFTWDGARVTLVATDTRRLALAQATATGPARAVSVVMPGRALREAVHLLAGVGGPITVLTDGLHLTLTVGRTQLTARVLDDPFPAYARVLPPETGTRVTVERRALLDALRRAEVVARVGVNRVTVQAAGVALTLTARAHDLGTAREEVAADIDGPALAVGFNAAFLRDALEAYDAPTVTLRMSGPLAPAVLEGDADCRTVIMPMHGG